ncbi:MAG: hypothetical protein V4691_07945 [Pseudomonadota bacterium]
MATLDKPLSYLTNMARGETGSDTGDSAALVRVRVDVKGFPASTKPLTPGNYTLGASPECDLIIPEAPADEIALLHVRTGGEPHELVSMSRGISLNGQPFNPQQRVTLMAETKLQVGPATITFIPRVNNFQRAGQMLRNVKAPASFTTPMALLLVAFVLGVTAWFSTGNSGPSPNDYVYSAPVRPFENASLPATRLTTAQETADELNRLFKASDIAHQVNATVDGTQVMVTGAISMVAEPRMSEIIRLVAARTRVDIRSSVRPDSTTLVESITGVSLSPSRYIVLRDGERFRVGDLMPNGWTVEQIDSTQVIVVRDGLRETLNLVE